MITATGRKSVVAINPRPALFQCLKPSAQNSRQVRSDME